MSPHPFSYFPLPSSTLLFPSLPPAILVIFPRLHSFHIQYPQLHAYLDTLILSFHSHLSSFLHKYSLPSSFVPLTFHPSHIPSHTSLSLSSFFSLLSHASFLGHTLARCH